MNWISESVDFSESDYVFLQSLDTEFGKLSLEQIESDRGSWRFMSMVNPGRHNLVIDLIPKYFFSEGIAKYEIGLWVEIAARHVKGELVSSDFLTFASISKNQILHGIHSIITISEFKSANTVFYFANVTVPDELRRWLYVDEQDEFPRVFIKEESALTEMEAWLACRRERASFSRWMSLEVGNGV